MMLTTKGRYAVMAVVDIAAQDSDSPIGLSDIAKRQDVKIAYLEQIVSKLRVKGILKSVRGPGGGYKLNKKCVEITIAEVINAIEEPIKMTRCGTKNGCRDNNVKCSTHELWQGLGDNIYNYLNSITIRDVCDGNINQICEEDKRNDSAEISFSNVENNFSERVH